MKQQKQSILITGCSSGIGLCATRQLQARGYRVFACARKLDDVDWLQQQGFDAVQLDLDDTASILHAVDEVLARTGGTLDALFNNGAYGQPGAVEDLTRDTLRAQFETNLFGTMELTNRVIPVMRAQGHGRIIMNSSLLGLVGLPYRGAYNASKFALEGLTDTLRLELAGSGIFVSLIEPGPITSHFRANAFKKYQQNINRADSAHRAIYEGMERRLTKPGPAAPFTLPPDAVVNKLIKALTCPHPKARYPVTLPSHFFSWARRLLPTTTLDWVLKRVSSGENK